MKELPRLYLLLLTFDELKSVHPKHCGLATFLVVVIEHTTENYLKEEGFILFHNLKGLSLS